VSFKVKLLSYTARVPTRGSSGAVGYDLYLDLGKEDETLHLPGNTTTAAPTGIAIALPPGHIGKIEGRSGLASKGITPRGGVIDPDYRGEVKVLLHNENPISFPVKHGDRIGQLVVYRVRQDEPVLVEVLDATERGGSGFGSTGA